MRRRSCLCATLSAVALGAFAAPASVAAPPKREQPANRCLTIASAPGGPVVARGAGYRAANRSRRAAMPFWFKPTIAGRFMLHDRDGRLVTAADDGAVTRGDVPGPAAEWTVRRATRRTVALRSEVDGRALALDGPSGDLVTVMPSGRRSERFELTRARGCRPFPEAKLGVRGPSAPTRNRDGTVFGYADAHLHVVSELRAGGRVISGESFNRYGIARALGRDAEAHGPDGRLDVTGNLLREGNPLGTHGSDGWPTFRAWPRFDTYTHQQVYHRWLQRAWRGGLRVVTAQIVEDETLCELQPQKSHSCDETETVVLGVQRLRELEAYVDAQSGGRGRGWFRLVDDPREARRVIARGKLAVLIGVESSSPFGCSEFMGRPMCDRTDVERGIALYRRLGISSLFVAHWVDNAFTGASVEEGEIGAFISLFQLETTGHPYSTGPCPDPGYGRTCNTKGLTDLGRYLVERLMDENMLIEVDHMSERGRLEALAIAERRRYPLVSSHTGSGGAWTPADLRRLYAVGGFATARPDSAGALARRILRFRAYGRPGHLLGVGLGSDTGGFSEAPGPDPEAADDPLEYPYRSYGGRARFVCQVSGKRRFDLNRDGVAHYGMYPDLLAYMRQKPGGRAASRVLFRSAEAYLRTWERAHRLRSDV